ncbi:hypothetical protein GCM10009825_41100 [Arthrobacter humicola]|uniref:Flp family type IVb pilin n=1 Tax=Arthrobacter humicola TaxID=409291 RepID=A0ABN2ZSY0_9MICC
MTTSESNLQLRHREVSHLLSTDEEGATATEYSILAGFIAIAIVAGVGAFGTALDSYITGLGTGVKVALGIP